MVVSYWLEVWVLHGILGSDALCMVIPEHLAEQVQCLIRHKLIVLRVDEFGPGLVRDRVLRQNVLIVGVESEAILVEILVKLLSAEHFGNLDELVIVVTSLEEGLPLEDHTGKHASERPNVQ